MSICILIKELVTKKISNLGTISLSSHGLVEYDSKGGSLVASEQKLLRWNVLRLNMIDTTYVSN